MVAALLLIFAHFSQINGFCQRVLACRYQQQMVHVSRLVMTLFLDIVFRFAGSQAASLIGRLPALPCRGTAAPVFRDLLLNGK
jgi:hypothetical protein